MSEPSAAAEWIAICEECPAAIFTADEIAHENHEEWGHPCRARRFRKPTACESYRSVWVKTTEHVHDGRRCSIEHSAIL